MLQQLRDTLRQFLDGTLDRRALEDWLVTHLQAILDSNDQGAVEIANALDVLFLKLNDGFVTDEEFVERAAALSLRPLTTLVVAASTTSITTESGSETYRRDPNQIDRLVRVA
ncbi:MAG: hypothetical protein HYS09_03885 [Chloroflexi bacterium]|nr:hypothetical protein [Chloroflexota bacterium]